MVLWARLTRPTMTTMDTMTVAEVLDLEPAPFVDGADAIVGAAETQAQGLGEVALGGLGVGREVLEDLVVAFFVHGGGGFRHATALPCRAGMGWGWLAVALFGD